MGGDLPPAVVCLAASAGGLEALTAFTAVLPAGFPAPVVIAQHLSPHHRSMLASLLGRAAALPVVELEEGGMIEPGVIYIAPENCDVALDGVRVALTSASGAVGPHPSANKLFESAGRTWKNRAIAIVLSGTGSDGAQGASAIDDAGGVIFAQDEDSSKYWSMPKAVVDRGLARAVLPPEMLAQAVQELLATGTMPTVEPATPQPDSLDRLAEMAEKEFDFGLMSYKMPTLQRRIGARMAATQSETIETYCEVVRDDPMEGRRLVDALLIPVTAFFRDHAAFETLRPEIRRSLAQAAEEGRPYRVWCAGCCTGEEAYSLSIILDEEEARLTQRVPVQIFATDVSERFIEQARRGLFTEDKLLDAPPDSVQRFFTPTAGGYRVLERLRERIIFARHDIIRSTPFMNVDLATCRNLLIYFKPEAQRTALRTLATALREDGLLFLGRSETVGELPEAFDEVSRQARIFRRNGYAGQRTGPRPMPQRSRRSALGGRRHAAPPSDQDRLMTFLLTESSPTFLIDSNDFVLASAGDLNRLITIAPGPFPSNIYGLLDEALRVDVRTTILASRRERSQKLSRIMTHKMGDQVISWRVTASPAPREGHEGELILRFEQMPVAQKASGLAEDHRDSTIEDLSLEADDLREELFDTRRQLRTVIEELEVTNEELQAANEELLSSNEEFQATNEELETTNEELQATNEELETVNDELTMKNREIAELNEDLLGVQESLTSPLFVFDDQDNLKSMNSAAIALVAQHGDGRRIERLSDLRGLPSGRQIVEMALLPPPKKPRQGRMRRIRIGPLEVQARVSIYGSGARAQRVLVLQDVTDLAAAKNRAEEQGRALMDLDIRQRALLDGIPAQTALLDETGRIIAVNEAWRNFARANGYQGDDFGVGANYITVCRNSVGPCSDEAMSVANGLESILANETNEMVVDYPCHAPNEYRWFQCIMRAVESDGRRAVVVMHIDNTRQVVLTQKIEAARDAEMRLSQSKSAFLANMSHELRTPLTVIIGFGDVIENEIFGPLRNDKYRHYVHDIVQSAQHLLSIITEIIDFSRVEAGALNTETVDTDIKAAMGFAIEMTRGAYSAKNLDIVFAAQDDLPHLLGEQRLLRQVFINILTNAAKALPDRGQIAASVRLSDTGGLVVLIEDNGPGVPDEVLNRMFEPFEQGSREVEATPNRGLGLGLSIVQSIVERHKGTVHAFNRAEGGLGIEIVFPKERLLPAVEDHDAAE